jgi:predicted amidohydrolase YtcJ
MSTDRTLVVRAAAIRTMDAEQPIVECIAVRRGRVEAIGSADDVEGALGGSVDRLDLRPAIVLPGLTDSHVHLVEWAVGLSGPDLSGCGSMAAALGQVASEAECAAAEAWLEFKGWNPSWRLEAELADLDEASRGRAVVLVAHDLHSGWLNSEAMRRLDIGAERAEPAGGSVERDSGGRLTGILKERALDWWYDGRPQASDAERRAAVLEGQATLHRLGITGVHSVEGPDSFRLVEHMEHSGELKLRVLHHMPQRFIDSLVECGIASGFGNDMLRIGGIKYFTDGALGSRTAWMLEPYQDEFSHGVCRLDPKEFRHDVERAARSGLAATVHAIGDAAVRMTLETLEGVGAAGLAIPHRVEHLQCVHPDDLSRAARSGIVASMQPSHLLTDIRLAERSWGLERSRRTLPLRSLLEAGTILAFGSDAPVEAADPREGFYGAIARRDREGYPVEGWQADERLNGLEVLRCYTEGPALAAGEADRCGRLAPGYNADFAAWNIDLATAEPELLRSAEVVATIVGGERVYQR